MNNRILTLKAIEKEEMEKKLEKEILCFLFVALILSFLDTTTGAYFGEIWKKCPKNYGILLPKLFWPTVRKKCSSDREKRLKFEAEG